MCNCVPWTWSATAILPFPFSTIRLSSLPLNHPQFSTTHFPILRNNIRVHLIECSVKPIPSRDGDGYGESEVDEKENDDELEFRRTPTDASLDKIAGESVKMERRRRRQVMRRSNMVAKQVISIQSAQSLGFVSQLWVDTTSWSVMVIEVRPSLLAGESERFLLQDVSKVGDVVLVEDEIVMDNDFRMTRLDTLVGYRVVTPERRNIGKVRGYTFNINSGAVESLELDSFGISIIPSSLVSTYGLLVEDVLEVIADTVVVHEAAAARIQRLTRGFLDAKNTGYSIDEHTEYVDDERPVRFDDGLRTRKGFSGQKSRSKKKKADDWDLPMDYL